MDFFFIITNIGKDETMCFTNLKLTVVWTVIETLAIGRDEPRKKIYKFSHMFNMRCDLD